jgi:hypothetical protein
MMSAADYLGRYLVRETEGSSRSLQTSRFEYRLPPARSCGSRSILGERKQNKDALSTYPSLPVRFSFISFSAPQSLRENVATCLETGQCVLWRFFNSYLTEVDITSTEIWFTRTD